MHALMYTTIGIVCRYVWWIYIWRYQLLLPGVLHPTVVQGTVGVLFWRGIYRVREKYVVIICIYVCMQTSYILYSIKV